MQTMRLITAILWMTFCFLMSSVQAAVIVQYPFTEESYAPAVVADHIFVGDFSYTGTGSIGHNSSTIVGGNSTGLDETDSGAPAVTGNRMNSAERTSYLHFTVTPDSSWKLDITELSFYRFAYGGGNLDVSYVIDEKETFLSEDTITLDDYYTATNITVSLSAMSDPIEFRFYGRDLNSENSTLRLDDVRLTGVVIPEPTTAVLFLAGICAMLGTKICALTGIQKRRMSFRGI